jgi:hypothetical protein
MQQSEEGRATLERIVEVVRVHIRIPAQPILQQSCNKQRNTSGTAENKLSLCALEQPPSPDSAR